METARWQELRSLFETVCELPSARWRDELQRLSDDPALIDEALDMLQARTAGFEHALAPLREGLARTPGCELQPGDRLGPWLLSSKLASGGMGTVFVAERADELFRQRVAVKLLRGGVADPALVQRLASERQILAELYHPNIARLFDGGTTPAGQPYLVMEYVDGLPLDRWVEAERPDLERRVALFLQICEAVQAAHRHLVVHCDLKPGNVLVRDSGQPVLLDFGIARLLDEAEGHVATEGFCTPAYASPELLAGAPVSTASDVFSLGVLLCELLADRRVERGIGGAVPAPGTWAGARCRWRRRLRGDLDAIVARACQADPERRYPSVEALARDLEYWRGHRPVLARDAAPGYRVSRWLRRHWRLGLASALAIVAMTGFVWRLDAERGRAEREAAAARQLSDFLVDTFDAADPRMRGPRGTEQPSARGVLDLGVAKVDAGLAETPAMLARMRLVLGRAYANLGERERAEAMLRTAAEALQSPQIARPDLAAQAWSRLSALLSDQTRADEAMDAARRSLALLRDGRATPDALADAYNTFGLAQMTASDFAGAHASLARALALHRQANGPASLQAAAVLHNIAGVYRREGNYAEAAEHFRQALAIKLRHGRDTVTVHSSRQGLAGVLSAQGRFDEAAALQADSVRLAEALVGRDSERVADSEMKLAMVLQHAGHYVRARPHYLEALAITERVLGRDSIDYAVVAGQLATLEEQRGDPIAAETLYREATEIRRARVPAGDRTVVRNEAYWGRSLLRLGRQAEGEALLARALPAWQAFFDAGSSAGDLVNSQLIEAEWRLLQGRFDEAVAALPAFDAQARPAMVARQALRARIAQARGDIRGAREQWRQAVALSSDYAGTDRAPTAQWRLAYAEVLLADGDAAAAREQLALAEPPLRRELVPQAEALRRLQLVQAALPSARR